MASWKLWAGTWKGRGHVLKRTGEVAATYTETSVWDVTRHTPAFIVFRVHQDTRQAAAADDEAPPKPMHTETGFLKILLPSGQATLNLCHPFPSGFVNEMSHGQWDENDQKLTLQASDFQRDLSSSSKNSDSKPVTGFKREYQLVDDGDKLVYDQYLAAGGEDLYHHLHCEMQLQK